MEVNNLVNTTFISGVNPSLSRVRKAKASTFSREVPQYFVNDKNQLEESPIKKDVQKIIDSAEYTSLSEIYDNYLLLEASRFAHIDEGEDLVHAREGFESDIDMFRELDEMRERYAAENPEVLGMSNADLFNYITEKIDFANKRIEEIKGGKQNGEDPSNEQKSE